MEPEFLESGNASFWSTQDGHPVCTDWKKDVEGAVCHLANIFLVLGFMGGSGFYGLLYLFFFLALGFLCSSIWAWLDACAADSFSWSFAIFVVCLLQVVHVAYRLRSVTFDKDFQDLYAFIFKKLGVSLTVYGEIVSCCEGEIHTIEKDHCYAMEGKTAIEKLSLLLSGRIQVTVNGEFLHYIYPYQFLDSPEWDSLRPSEEGIFQVTLRADSQCRYIGWRRKKLYLLLAKNHYIAKVFSVLVRNDIADKLFSLNDQASDTNGFRYDLRLPSFGHMPVPDLDKTDMPGPEQHCTTDLHRKKLC